MSDEEHQEPKKFWLKDIVIPLIGTVSALATAVFAAWLAHDSATKTDAIIAAKNQFDQVEARLKDLEKSFQFERDTSRQYVAIIYPDLIGPDSKKQKLAISLVQILEPHTAQKLLLWLKDSSAIADQNKSDLNSTLGMVNIAVENSRARIFVHLAADKNKDKITAASLTAALARSSFTDVTVEQDVSADNLRIQYFRPEDEDLAKRISSALQTLQPAGTPPIPPRYDPALKNSPYTFAVFIQKAVF